MDDYSTEDNLSEATTEPLMDTADDMSVDTLDDNTIVDNESLESVYQEAQSSPLTPRFQRVQPPFQTQQSNPNAATVPKRQSIVLSDVSESIVW